MWEFDDEKWDDLLDAVENRPPPSRALGLANQRVPAHDPDVILNNIKPRTIQRQAREWSPIMPLAEIVDSTKILLQGQVREKVWNVLNAGAIDKANARVSDAIFWFE